MICFFTFLIKNSEGFVQGGSDYIKKSIIVISMIVKV